MHESGEALYPGNFDVVGEICAFVALGAQRAGFESEDVFHIELACDEACTNVIEHAYGGENRGHIHVAWEHNKRRFSVTIRDHGRPFEPAEVPEPLPPGAEDDLDRLKIGGLGLHFMRRLMDEVRFSFDPAGGNSLVMVKYLEAEAP
ncbi:MAG: ATP-binding protein [Candidatus Promineifilaceae bacterium]